MAPQYASKSKQKARALRNDIDAWRKNGKSVKKKKKPAVKCAGTCLHRGSTVFIQGLWCLQRNYQPLFSPFFLNAGIDSTRNPLRIGITQSTEYRRESGLKKANHV